MGLRHIDIKRIGVEKRDECPLPKPLGQGTLDSRAFPHTMLVRFPQLKASNMTDGVSPIEERVSSEGRNSLQLRELVKV